MDEDTNMMYVRINNTLRSYYSCENRKVREIMNLGDVVILIQKSTYNESSYDIVLTEYGLRIIFSSQEEGLRESEWEELCSIDS